MYTADDLVGIFPQLDRDFAEDYVNIFNYLTSVDHQTGWRTDIIKALNDLNTLMNHNALELEHGFTDPIAKIGKKINTYKAFFDIFIEPNGIHKFINAGAQKLTAPIPTVFNGI